MESEADQAEALARLEAALDRIAKHAVSPAPAAVPVGVIAARLDSLIAEIRSVLANED
jgi:hypothetical protein